MPASSDSTSAKIQGVLPAIVSPHDGADRFDEQAFVQQARFLYQAGVHGLYVCGGTGEGYLMRLEERKAAAALAVEESAGKGQVIVHVGAQAVRDAIELAEHAARTGAQGVASIPPAGRSHPELVAWYRDIAAASGLPTFIYHFPGMTGKALGVYELSELLAVPGVAGLKFTHSDLFLLSRVLRRHPEALVFNGSDEMVAPGLAYGARGCIGTWYNLVPQVFLRIWSAFERGDLGAAMAEQARFNRMADVAWEYDVLRSFDLLMRRSGLARHVWRRPFLPFTREEEQQAWQRLEPLCRDLGLEL